MDVINEAVLEALEQIICAAENLATVNITQDIDKEQLLISNCLGQETIMECSGNSVGATIKQICGHINHKTLFRYEEGYKIGGTW